MGVSIAIVAIVGVVLLIIWANDANKNAERRRVEAQAQSEHDEREYQKMREKVVAQIGGPPLPASFIEPFVNRLLRIYKQHGKLVSVSGISDIGREIHAAQGHYGMVQVCWAVGARAGRDAMRELEVEWHGIGRWQR